jgi:uncharacterized protein with NRDE domain
MCLIVFSIHYHPTYKLIVAANRDEFYARKTEPASFWPNQKNILGGRDLEAMNENGTCGTWMGMTTSGKIAMVTNYRDFKNLKTKAPSRGHLVSDFLTGDASPKSYLQSIEKNKGDYNGFNLIVGDIENLMYLSNYKEGIEKLSKGLYGLSNALLDTPWPKVELAKSKSKVILSKPLINPEELFELMRDESRAADNRLPETGIGIERERALSSMFIKTEGYGSRCSTVILVKDTGETEFVERTYNLLDFTFETRRFDFKIAN